MKPIRQYGPIDWLCLAYIVLVGLVIVANIVIHVIGPW